MEDQVDEEAVHRCAGKLISVMDLPDVVNGTDDGWDNWPTDPDPSFLDGRSLLRLEGFGPDDLRRFHEENNSIRFSYLYPVAAGSFASYVFSDSKPKTQ